MRTSVISRSVTKLSRLAVSVPLAAVVAVGAVGCSPHTSGSAAGARGASPEVSVSATPSTGPVPTPAPSAAATSPAPSAPTSSPGAAVAAEAVSGGSSGEGVSVEFGGLPEGGRLTAGGGPVAFSVTFTNNSGHTLSGVAPVVAARPFDGARCKLVEGTAKGTLQREDGSGWTDLPISQGTGMDYATTGDKAAFTMAPGTSRTVHYRVQLSVDNGPAPLVIEADAYLRPGTTFRSVGRALRHLAVVDPHRPTASMPSMTPIPTSVTAGGAAVEVEVSPGNFTGAPFTSAAPLLTLGATQNVPYIETALNPKDVTAEVMVDGGWKALPVHDDCGNATVDTSSLAGPLATGRVVNYLFRFTIAGTLPAGIASLDLSAGAVADGHYAAPVSTKVAVKR